MSTSDQETAMSPMEQLLETHKEEQKQLTTKVIGLRKSVPKSDKRKKREVNSRIADLEYDLKKKHEEEIRVLKATEAGLDPNEEVEQNVRSVIAYVKVTIYSNRDKYRLMTVFLWID